VTAWLVVGGGTAGCVLASRLSEDPANHVTLVEAGPPAGEGRAASYLDALAAPGALWDGLTVSDGNGRRRPYPQGRGLGGSSLVAGGVLSGAVVDGVLLPRRAVEEAELGAVDRALLAVSTDAAPVTLATASCAAAYLRPAQGRRNLDVLTECPVARVRLAGRRATGAVLAHGDAIAADRVVVAAGAIQTPALLLRSGVATEGIGAGLADHAGRIIELSLRDGVAPDVHGLVTGASVRRGALEIVALNHLGPARQGVAALLAGVLDVERRGTVRLSATAPDDPLEPPAVDLGRLTNADAAGLAAALDLAGELLGHQSFVDVVAEHRVAGGLGGYAHATSTCAIGRVVDEDGAVRGYEGLYVGDASALPVTPPSGTLLPVVLLAERLAEAWRFRSG
jgi:choline dehydrogenase/5-(hydroxymethyl)furfural/furfural oxidase